MGHVDPGMLLGCACTLQQCGSLYGASTACVCMCGQRRLYMVLVPTSGQLLGVFAHVNLFGCDIPLAYCLRTLGKMQPGVGAAVQ